MLTFCFRHAAQAFTLREIAGTVASTDGSDCLGREAAGDIEVPPFSVTCDQVRLGGISKINNNRDKSAVLSLQRRFAESNLEMVRDRVWSWCGDLPAICRNMKPLIGQCERVTLLHRPCLLTSIEILFHLEYTT